MILNKIEKFEISHSLYLNISLNVNVYAEFLLSEGVCYLMVFVVSYILLFSLRCGWGLSCSSLRTSVFLTNIAWVFEPFLLYASQISELFLFLIGTYKFIFSVKQNSTPLIHSRNHFYL